MRSNAGVSRSSAEGGERHSTHVVATVEGPAIELRRWSSSVVSLVTHSLCALGMLGARGGDAKKARRWAVNTLTKVEPSYALVRLYAADAGEASKAKVTAAASELESMFGRAGGIAGARVECAGLGVCLDCGRVGRVLLTAPGEASWPWSAAVLGVVWQSLKATHTSVGG